MDEQELEKELENACTSLGCVNYAASGWICCLTCLHGIDQRLPKKVAKEKLRREKEKHE